MIIIQEQYTLTNTYLEPGFLCEYALVPERHSAQKRFAEAMFHHRKLIHKEQTRTHAQGTDPRVALGAEGELPWKDLGAWGESRRRDSMAVLRAGPPPPVCRWGRRPHLGATD